MDYNLTILPKALNDIKQIALWYDSKQKGLGTKFISYLKKEIYYIQSNPLQFQSRYKNIRVCNTRKFPYSIHFSIQKHKIIIKAVFHTSRNTENL